ncbi:palmitoyltransferase [Achlya hypogyna]|uniref:Palmitoyltransferase n=1 Tax=Achlya hypogyna TaxID=1202772 RepID=A0A1V9YE06_ACHHY|nr:palmitoyltransferase [Achlya hypogyna]
MWFVKDGGFVVTLLGIGLMVGGVGLCLHNWWAWKGLNAASTGVTLVLGLLSVLSAIAHWYTMTTNPGTVPKHIHVLSLQSDACEAEHMPLTDNDGSLYCEFCDATRPKCVTHCDSCQGCIAMMDHHCPWVNNCIGIGNLNNFLLLLVYLSLTCGCMGVMTIAQVGWCPAKCGFQDGMQPGKSGVAVMAVAFIFGALCVIMLTLEAFSIHYDERLAWIVQATRAHGRPSTLVEKLGVICGSSTFRWRWLLPRRDVHRLRSSEEMEIILGYRPRPSTN